MTSPPQPKQSRTFCKQGILKWSPSAVKLAFFIWCSPKTDSTEKIPISPEGRGRRVSHGQFKGHKKSYEQRKTDILRAAPSALLALLGQVCRTNTMFSFPLFYGLSVGEVCLHIQLPSDTSQGIQGAGTSLLAKMASRKRRKTWKELRENCNFVFLWIRESKSNFE